MFGYIYINYYVHFVFVYCLICMIDLTRERVCVYYKKSFEMFINDELDHHEANS